MKPTLPQEYERKQSYVYERERLTVDAVFGLAFMAFLGCLLGLVIGVFLPL